MYEKWLKAFHMVASEGGVTRAARALNVGQPTVSAHVKTLEDYFRVELFYRRGKRLELTEAGRTLHDITRMLYGHESEAVTFLRSAGGGQHGRLRIGGVGPYDVIELVHAFRSTHPSVELLVDVLRPDELLRRLRDFELDVGIFAEPPGEPEFTSLLYARHPVRIMVPARHRLLRRKAIHITELEGETFVLRDPGSGTRRVFEEGLRRAGVSIRAALQINSREAVREAVARGMGLGVILEPEHASHPAIRILAVDDMEMWVPAYVTCVSTRRTRPIVASFMRLAQQSRQCA